ncbi:MAG TPA: lysophospholipid acyltransferase family protein [Acidimicrobiia bacterium]|jgi:1-acyl-sn-glycerol-3-phosphate acyltransferase
MVGVASERASSRSRLIFYRYASALVVWVCTRPWRVRVFNSERAPAEGGFVFAPSHRSMLDIPWVAATTRRRIRFMGKASLFRVPVLGWFFSALGGFPVERDGSDRGPLRDSLAILQSGEVLAVYPEGTRQHGREIQPLQAGAAYLAIKAGVPIVPVAIAGSEEPFRGPHRLPRFGRGVVLVGEPIQPPARTGSVVKRELVDHLTAQLRVELQKLSDEAFVLRDAPSKP